MTLSTSRPEQHAQPKPSPAHHQCAFLCMCSRETTEAVSWEAKDSRADPSSPSSSLALSPSSSEALDSNRGLSTPPHDCMLHMSLQSSIQAASSSSPCRNSESSSFIWRSCAWREDLARRVKVLNFVTSIEDHGTSTTPAPIATWYEPLIQDAEPTCARLLQLCMPSLEHWEQ